MLPPLRKALEEIIIQNIADFQQQIGINPFAVEDFVGVLAGATKLCSQPGDAAPLPCQFSLDKFSYVRFFVHRFAFARALRDGQTKWAEPSVCLFETEGSAKPVNGNKQQRVHALRRELFATYSPNTSNLPIISFRIKA